MQNSLGVAKNNQNRGDKEEKGFKGWIKQHKKIEYFFFRIGVIILYSF